MLSSELATVITEMISQYLQSCFNWIYFKLIKNQQLWIEKEDLGTRTYLVELLTTDGLLGEGTQFSLIVTKRLLHQAQWITSN